VKGPEEMDEDLMVESSPENLIGPRLEDLDARSVLTSVNDTTRLMPTPRQVGIDLCQVQKAIEAAKLATRKEETIILVASAWTR